MAGQQARDKLGRFASGKGGGSSGGNSTTMAQPATDKPARDKQKLRDAVAQRQTGVAKHIIGVTVSYPELKSAEPIFKKIRVTASSKEEAIKKAKSYYRKAGLKVGDAFHHSTIEGS